MAGFGGEYDQREEIRDAIDIVDLVGRYLSLRRQGANFVGKCPWHDDKRPSLQVNSTRQTFKCWVCNIGGDVFSFVMKIENVDFKESMQILAEMAGIELRKPKPRGRVGGKPAPRLPLEQGKNADGSAPAVQGYVPAEITRTALYRAMEWLSGKYRDAFLNSPEAEEARRYVRERGITEQSSERFQIGYAPLDYDAVLNWIGGDRNRVRALETAGVLAYREEYDELGRVKARPQYASTPKLADAERRRYYDRFRGRLIFPIRDVQDRVVAFGGRLLPNTTLKSDAKYVNSPETPIFHKSKMLYGLDLARQPIRLSNSAIVTEGYTDCIVTSQFGFENVVAVLGTALGAEHVKILKRFASKTTLLLDGDEAGQKRAKEVLRFFVEQGVDMRVLTLPDNDDPCEFLLKHGAAPFRELLEKGSIDALDHAFNAATAGIDLDDDVVGSARALDSLLEIVALAPLDRNSVDESARIRVVKTLQRLATRFRVSEEEIQRMLQEKRVQARSFAERAEEREARFAARRRDEETRDDELVSLENQIALFRQSWCYPVAGPDDETDEQLRSLFPPFESSLWGDRRFMPSALEREYLEFWLTDPSVFTSLVAKIDGESLRSPIARQIDLVARDSLERGEEPTFESVMLRYEDERMKSFLIELDESAVDKGLPEVVKNPERRAALLDEIVAGFARAQFEREVPKKIEALREKNATPEERLQALLELQRSQRKKRRITDDPNDSNVPTDRRDSE